MFNQNYKKISDELKFICHERMMFAYNSATKSLNEKDKKFYLKQFRFWRRELMKLK